MIPLAWVSLSSLLFLLASSVSASSISASGGRRLGHYQLHFDYGLSRLDFCPFLSSGSRFSGRVLCSAKAQIGPCVDASINAVAPGVRMKDADLQADLQTALTVCLTSHEYWLVADKPVGTLDLLSVRHRYLTALSYFVNVAGCCQPAGRALVCQAGRMRLFSFCPPPFPLPPDDESRKIVCSTHAASGAANSPAC